MAGATLLGLVLGSLHAYSVLIEPLEQHLGASRASVSLAYSLATLSLVTGVFCTSGILRRMTPAWLALLASFACAAGLALAAAADGLGMLYVGFGLMFGFANGLGYALSIERAGAAYPQRKGVAIGVVTAAYCAGAIIFSRVFAGHATVTAYSTGLHILAVTIAICGLVAAVLLLKGPDVAGADEAVVPVPRNQLRQVAMFWLIYFLGVASGLMALGHAAAIVSAAGGTTAQLAAGAMIVSFGAASGSIGGGWLADRVSAAHVLTGSLVMVFGSMLLMGLVATPVMLVLALGITGLAYGGLITIIPVVVSRTFAAEVSLKAFGRVFTAWGFAGLVGPWLAGAIYDADQRYFWAFTVAATAALAAAILSCFSLGSSRERSQIGR